jgi:hypothetical protein
MYSARDAYRSRAAITSATSRQQRHVAFSCGSHQLLQAELFERVVGSKSVWLASHAAPPEAPLADQDSRRAAPVARG